MLKKHVPSSWRAPWYRMQSRWRSIWVPRDIGVSSFIDPSVHVLGWRHVSIGHHTIVGQDSVFNINHRSGNEKTLLIGNNSFIGRRNFFTVGSLIELGDFLMTGPNCQFIGAGHRFDDPFQPYISTGISDDTLRVGVNCWFGAGATVIGTVRIGHGCIIGAGAVVRRDVPPFSIVVGSKAEIKRRYCVPQERWAPIEEFSEECEEQLPSEEEYLEILKSNCPNMPMAWRAAGKIMGDFN